MDHTFAIPVYGEAPNLEALLESLRTQTEHDSQIVLTSSTPSPALEKFAHRYGVPLRINPHRIGIAADWNFALNAAHTKLVTIAHQDDRYEATYLAQMRAALERHPEALLAFCDYREHTPVGARPANINLRVKRGLCQRGFGVREAIALPREKVRLLSLGNPICCPSVMLSRALLTAFQFPSGFQTNLDWAAWLELARGPGEFVYLRQPLVSKGIHPASETTSTIASRVRAAEDRVLFGAFWPKPVAALLAVFYTLGYRANRIPQFKGGQD